MHLELRMADEGVFFAPTANKARKSTGLRSMRLLLARLSVVSVLLGSDLPARSQVDVSNDLETIRTNRHMPGLSALAVAGHFCYIMLESVGTGPDRPSKGTRRACSATPGPDPRAG